MKKKRSIYESLNKDFKKGIKRFFWFSYTTIKYSILSLMFYLYKKKLVHIKYHYYYLQEKDRKNLKEC